MRESNGGFFGKTAILESFVESLVVRLISDSHKSGSGLGSKNINCEVEPLNIVKQT